MNFGFDSCGFAIGEETIPCGRLPFSSLTLLAIIRGACTASARRRARLQNDLPLAAPDLSTGC
jgi:hypothetical protein